MGRITIPFRTRWDEQRRELRHYRDALLVARQKAFDELVHVWSSELAAMSICNTPTVLDTMLLAALVDDRMKLIEAKERIAEIKSQLQSL